MNPSDGSIRTSSYPYNKTASHDELHLTPTFTLLTMVLLEAIILTAGRGERIRQRTDNIPTPLRNVKGKCLSNSTRNLATVGMAEPPISHVHPGGTA